MCGSLLSRLTEGKMYRVECNPHLRAPRSRFRDRRRPPQGCSWSASGQGRQPRPEQGAGRIGRRLSAACAGGHGACSCQRQSEQGLQGRFPEKQSSAQPVRSHCRNEGLIQDKESPSQGGRSRGPQSPHCQLQQSKAGPTVWEDVFIFPKYL